MVLRVSRYGLFYGCTTYPHCTATHGAHKATGRPLGIPADKATKAERMATHAVFDPLWGGMRPVFNDRREAYQWMAGEMGLKTTEAHIARFDAAQCRRLRGIIAARFPGDRTDEAERDSC